MAIIVQGSAVSIPSGQRQITAENVPDTMRSCVFFLKRNTTLTPLFWPSSLTTLDAAAWISIDGGPFRQNSHFTGAQGGIQLEKGIEMPEFIWGFTLFPGLNRQVRFEITVNNGPLSTEFDLVAF